MLKIAAICLPALVLGLAACSSGQTQRESGGGASDSWARFAGSAMAGQNADDDEIPVVEWDERIQRPTTETPPADPPKPTVTLPKPLPAPIKPMEAEEAIEYPIPESYEDNNALAYDLLRRAARSKGDDSKRFVPVTRKLSDGVEDLTQYYKRLMTKLNPGF